MICRENSPIPIPISEMALGTPTWLNLCFVEEILRKSEGDNSIQVIDISMKPATNKGDNYGSDMIRVNIEFSCDHKIIEQKSIIFKMEPISEGVCKDLITSMGVFNTEIGMMTNTLEKMNKLLGYPLSAKCLYTQTEKPAFLVIEDLAPFGFRMADRVAGLDLDHCILALHKIASFHAASVAVCEKEPNQKKIYLHEWVNHHQEHVKAFYVNSCKALAHEIINWPELKRYLEKITKFSDCIFEVRDELLKPSKNEFNVIIHGDFWVNNILYKYNHKGKPIDCIFVDFQLSSYTRPAVELHNFFNTNSRIDVIDNHWNLLLNEYLKTLTKVMKQLNCKTQPPSITELKLSLRQTAKFGMITSIVALPLTISNKEEAKSLDDMMKDGAYTNPAYKNEAYRKIIAKKISVYDEWGLLDF